MNATGALSNTRKGLLSAPALPRITAVSMVAAVGLILVGIVLGVWLAEYFVGYSAIGSVDVIVSDSTGGALPDSLGTFQVHQVESWFGLQGNRLEITVTRTTSGPLP